ncbi:MAG: hypothetical protein M0Q41_13425 [Bacteroidales bacterium]|nr:hypothetical protein [Bacteroidales bacterium]
MKKLTPHLWRLYDSIKFATGFGKSLNVEEIAEMFPDVYEFKKQKGNYSNCPQLYKDIDIINASHEVEKIIIKKNNNFRLATEEEAIEYHNKLVRRLIHYRDNALAVKYKIGKDGQGKLLSAQLTPIDENSKAREFTESFIKK